MADKKIGNSIFRFEQKAGIDSKLGNWGGRKFFGEEEDGNGDFGSGSLPSISLECSKLTYLPINIDVLLKFKVSGKSEKDWGGGYDIEIVSSNKSITLSSKKFSVEKGWTFLTNIKSTTTGKVSLQVKVDGTLKNTFEFVFQDSKDVFQKSKVDKLISELKYIQDFAEQELAPEYDENYCMQSAERGLSELLSDDKNFYSVYRKTHLHKNKIGFSGKTVYDRGNDFVKNGFVEKVSVFNKYSINSKKRELINKSKNNDEASVNYKKVRYDIIELSQKNADTLRAIFESDMKSKEVGYHVYYFTVTNGFHTLTLVINNFDPCKATYEIWDQHGITSSSGDFSEIAEGIRKQTSWTFANTCLNRYKSGKTQSYDSTETKLWKIKRK